MNKQCTNCGAKSSNGTWLNPVAINGSILDNAWLCDDCQAEEARVEAHADELAATCCCEARQHIIETAQTTRELVNRLVAHDQAGCLAVALGTCDDCGSSCPQSDLRLDLASNLTLCPACHISLSRHDAAMARLTAAFGPLGVERTAA